MLRDKFGGIPRELRILFVFQFATNASNFIAFPLMAVYMAEHLRLSAAEVGTVLTLHLAGGRCLPIITGPLADRFGFCRFLVAGLATRALGFLGFALVDGVFGLALATLTIGLGTAFCESAVYGIFGRQSTEIVARVFVLNNLSLNLGVIAGPLLGAALLSLDPVYPFVAAAGVFATLSAVGSRMMHIDDLYRSRSSMADSWHAVFHDRTYLVFLAATFMWWCLFSQIFVLFPLLAATIAASDRGATAVFIANGVVGLICVGLSFVVFARTPPTRVLPLCYLALIAIYEAARVKQTLPWLLLVVCLYTIVETFILPAIESIAATLAQDGRQATFFGALGLVWGIGGSVGNYVGSGLAMTGVGASLIWNTLAAIAVAGLILTLVFLRRLRRS